MLRIDQTTSVFLNKKQKTDVVIDTQHQFIENRY